MARPTQFPDWATNANFAGGPTAGTPTKVLPSAGRRADGWRPQDIPPAPEQNEWQAEVAAWLHYQDEPVIGTTDYPLGTRTQSKISRSVHSLQNFSVGNVASGIFQQGATPTNNDHMCFELNPPNGARLNTVSIGVRGAAGHGALPTSTDRAGFSVFEISNSAQTLIGGTSDTSATTVIYEAFHLIILTGLTSPTFSRANRYMVYMKGEGGVNAVAGLQVWGCGFVFDQLTAVDSTAG